MTEKRLELLKECIEESVTDLFNQYIKEIMSYKSFSYGEAVILSRKFFLYGILPKSNDFYKVLDNIKILWEMG